MANQRKQIDLEVQIPFEPISVKKEPVKTSPEPQIEVHQMATVICTAVKLENADANQMDPDSQSSTSDLKHPKFLKREIKFVKTKEGSPFRQPLYENQLLIEKSLKSELHDTKPIGMLKVKTEENLDGQNVVRVKTELNHDKNLKLKSKKKAEPGNGIKTEKNGEYMPPRHQQWTPRLERIGNDIKSWIKIEDISDDKNEVKPKPDSRIKTETKPSISVNSEVKQEVDLPSQHQCAPKLNVIDTKPRIKREDITDDMNEVKHCLKKMMKSSVKIEIKEMKAQGLMSPKLRCRDNTKRQLKTENVHAELKKDEKDLSDSDPISDTSTDSKMTERNEDVSPPTTAMDSDYGESSVWPQALPSQNAPSTSTINKNPRSGSTAVPTETRKFECFRCKKEFKLMSNCKQHIRNECSNPIKSFECKECGKGFAYRHSLADHLRVHFNEKPFACDINGCQKRFAAQSNLIAHRRIHTGDRPYRCQHPGCNRSFTRNHSLHQHKRCHSGSRVRPYRCNRTGCGKSFAQNTHLVAHKRTHANERPFKCQYPGCGAAFSQKIILNRHNATHSGDRPHACSHPGCDRSFALNYNLLQHMRIHTGLKSHRCNHPLCGKSFNRMSSLVRHKRIHSLN